MWSDAPKSIIHAILETNVEIFKTYHCHLRPSQQYHPLHVFNNCSNGRGHLGILLSWIVAMIPPVWIPPISSKHLLLV
jgi:hypothetical protein